MAEEMVKTSFGETAETVVATKFGANGPTYKNYEELADEHVEEVAEGVEKEVSKDAAPERDEQGRFKAKEGEGAAEEKAAGDEGGGGDVKALVQSLSETNKALLAALERLPRGAAAEAREDVTGRLEKLPDLDAIDPDDDPIAYQKALGAHIKAGQASLAAIETKMNDADDEAYLRDVGGLIKGGIGALAAEHSLPATVVEQLKADISERFVMQTDEEYKGAIKDPLATINRLIAGEVKRLRVINPGLFKEGKNGADKNLKGSEKGGAEKKPVQKLPGAGAAANETGAADEGMTVPKEPGTERTSAIVRLMKRAGIKR